MLDPTVVQGVDLLWMVRKRQEWGRESPHTIASTVPFSAALHRYSFPLFHPNASATLFL